MDIYHCMTCGQRWPHGGMREHFVAVCQHWETTRVSPEGPHDIRVGERAMLEAMYARHQVGEPLVRPNDQNHPVPGMPASQTVPRIEPDRLDALAKRVGMTPQAVEALLIGLFPPAQERPVPEHATDDIIPIGQLETWGPA